MRGIGESILYLAGRWLGPLLRTVKINAMLKTHKVAARTLPYRRWLRSLPLTYPDVCEGYFYPDFPRLSFQTQNVGRAQLANSGEHQLPVQLSNIHSTSCKRTTASELL